jgi:hypothetical protein
MLAFIFKFLSALLIMADNFRVRFPNHKDIPRWLRGAQVMVSGAQEVSADFIPLHSYVAPTYRVHGQALTGIAHEIAHRHVLVKSIRDYRG